MLMKHIELSRTAESQIQAAQHLLPRFKLWCVILTEKEYVLFHHFHHH